MEKTRVLFVCLGNICRSPLAEGVLRHLAAGTSRGLDMVVDSAGTFGWHQGKAPDARSIRLASRFGIDISGLRARKIEPRDFHDFDLILAMDRGNLRDLSRLSPSEGRADCICSWTLPRGRRATCPILMTATRRPSKPSMPCSWRVAARCWTGLPRPIARTAERPPR